MSKILLYAAYPLWRKNTLVTMARARMLADQGHEVVLAHCDARAGTCACNYTASPLICAVCRSGIRGTARNLGLRTVPLGVRGRFPAQAHRTPFSDRRELVEGVLSGIVSTFRVLPHAIRRRSLLGRIQRNYYDTARRLLAGMVKLVESERPDRIEVFNGRHACCRPPLLIARRRGVPFNTLEILGHGHPIVFQGHTAHDRKAVQARVLRHPADMELAQGYYAARRNRRAVNRFAGRHSPSFQPPSAEGFDRRVTVFLSSQDEFASLGKSWQSPFPPEHEVIEAVCRAFPRTFFVVRFHPNQAGIKNDILSDYAGVAALPNVKLYPPTDTANSYRLVEWSDVVVGFNSTITVEACWMGKAAIMLGPSYYDELEVAYTPADVGALIELLRRDTLPPRDRANAARLAHYLLRDWDDLPYLGFRHGRVAAQGFRRSHPWATYLCRYLDVACCQLVKGWLSLRLMLGGR